MTMATYQYAILEDSPIDQLVLQTYLRRIPNLSMMITCARPMDILPLLQNNKVDILFSDINLPDLDGLTFLRTLANPPKLIMTTSTPNFALEAFDIGVVDYLVKPFSFERLLRAVNRAIEQISVVTAPVPPSPPTTILLKAGWESVRFNVASIEYIEAFGAFSKVYTDTGVTVISDLLARVLDKLPADRFMRVHKSYVAALSKIKQIGSRDVLVGSVRIPLGATYREQVEKRWRDTP